MKKIMIKNF